MTKQNHSTYKELTVKISEFFDTSSLISMNRIFQILSEQARKLCQSIKQREDRN